MCWERSEIDVAMVEGKAGLFTKLTEDEINAHLNAIADADA